MATKKVKKVKRAKRVEEDEAPQSERRPKREKKAFKGKMVPEALLSPKAKKIIAKADKLEVEIADRQDEFRTALEELTGELGGVKSFEHPDRGPMSIMERGYLFWRAKPGGNSTKKKTAKAAKKTSTKSKKKTSKKKAA